MTNRYLLGYGVAGGWQKGKAGYHFYLLDERSAGSAGEANAAITRYDYDENGTGYGYRRQRDMRFSGSIIPVIA
jgi:hypothetical protein